MAWVETASPNFRARHESADDDDVVGVLELLEGTRERLEAAFPSVPDEIVDVVIHGSDGALAMARPVVPVARALTAPAARRYLVGWPGRRELHVLAPRLLAKRASNVPGSREMELLAPAALYAQLVIGHNNERLPPPFRPAQLRAGIRWAWLWLGSAQWFSGQTQHARPAIARRLREGGEPAFPPSLRDAALLGGTLVDLLAREEGEQAAVELVCRLPDGPPRRALVQAFHGRAVVHTEGTWRGHLARLAAGGS